MNGVNYNYGSYRRGIRPSFVDQYNFEKLSVAEKLLNKLNESIKDKGFATVAEFYELTNGVVLKEDTEYGWTNLLRCNIQSTRFGYILAMPNAELLNSNPIREACDLLRNADESGEWEDVREAIDLLSNNS